MSDPLIAALVRVAEAAAVAWLNALVQLGYVGDGPEAPQGWRDDPVSYAA